MEIKKRDLKKILQRSLCMVVLFAVLLGMTACADKNEALKAPMEAINMEKTVEIQTQYGPIKFPEVLFGNMRHVETTQGNVAVEIFYMVGAAEELEVFRIYYGDSNMGSLMGYLTTDDGEVSVSYALCEYAEEEFADEQDLVLFYNMMQAFSVVTNSIQTDARFSQLRAVAPVDEQETKLQYWTVTLPDNVQYEENEADGCYRVDFYGVLGGERIELYYLGLGDMEADTVLGYFTVDGQQKPVVIGNSDVDAYENWSAEEQMILYNMMDSLNGVIEAITTHKDFSQYPGETWYE